jgi:tetratricopeptide (TPR) repeat protein
MLYAFPVSSKELLRHPIGEKKTYERTRRAALGLLILAGLSSGVKADDRSLQQPASPAASSLTLPILALGIVGGKTGESAKEIERRSFLEKSLVVGGAATVAFSASSQFVEAKQDRNNGFRQILFDLQYPPAPSTICGDIEKQLVNLRHRLIFPTAQMGDWRVLRGQFLIAQIQAFRRLNYPDNRNNEKPSQLSILLVNSLVGKDIFELLNKSQIPEERKSYLRASLLSCTNLGQQIFIVFKENGDNVGVIGAPDHVLVFDFKNNTIIDAARGVVGTIDLNRYYNKLANGVWVLKPECTRPLNNNKGFGKILKNRIMEAVLNLQALTETELEELLSCYYPWILMPADTKYGATPNMLKNCGVILHELGYDEDAITIYDKAIALNPNDSTIYYNKGNALFALGRHEEAEAAYKESLLRNPNDPDAYYNYGLYLFNRPGHDFKGAAQAFEQAVNLNPKDAESYFSLGAAYFNLGQRDKAIDSWVNAVRLEPDFLNLLDTVLYSSGDKDAIIKEVNRRIATTPNIESSSLGIQGVLAAASLRQIERAI